MTRPMATSASGMSGAGLISTRGRQPWRLAQYKVHLHGDCHRHGLAQVRRWAKHPLRKSALRLRIEAWLKRLQFQNVADNAIAVDNAPENDTAAHLRSHRIRSELGVDLAQGDRQLYVRVARAINVVKEATCRLGVACDDELVRGSHQEGPVADGDLGCGRNTHLALVELVLDPRPEERPVLSRDDHGRVHVCRRKSEQKRDRTRW